jgi:RNA polymerase sigma factor (sigma-70 family)
MVETIHIQQCKNGDSSSFKEIYNASSAYVYTIVKNYIKDEEYRRDIMQETFAAIFTSIKNFDEEKGSFKNWIAKITVVNCIAHLRKSIKMSFDFSLTKLEEIAADDILKLDQLSQQEIESLLTEMPIGYKTIFLLSVIDDYSHKEIAALLNITAETSRSQLMRGISWIKKNITVTTSNRMAYGNR